MPKLFIANTTKQEHMFSWRIPPMPNPAMKHIRAGQQIVIDNLSSEEVQSIIEQHEKYGLKSAMELSRLKGFVGLSYRIGDSVPIDAMLATYETNDNALADKAQERREVQAAATSEGIANALSARTGIDKEVVRPKSLQVEVTEDTQGTGTRNVASGVEVPADPKAVEQGKRSRS